MTYLFVIGTSILWAIIGNALFADLLEDQPTVFALTPLLIITIGALLLLAARYKKLKAEAIQPQTTTSLLQKSGMVVLILGVLTTVTVYVTKTVPFLGLEKRLLSFEVISLVVIGAIYIILEKISQRQKAPTQKN